MVNLLKQSADETLRIQEHIAQTLQDHGVSAKAHFSFAKNDPRLEGLRLHNSNNDDPFWLVAEDISIQTIDDEYQVYQLYGVELISPVFIFSEEAIGHVKHMAKVMSEHYRIRVDKSTGFHVHIGNHAQGFSLETLQKFLAFFWTFEAELSQMHPHHRLDNPHCRSLFYSSNLGTADPYTEPPRRKGMLKVFAAKSIEELCKLAHYKHDTSEITVSRWRLGCSIINLLPGRERTKKTVEFRTHEAVLLDEEGINRAVHWLTTCNRLLTYARDKPLDKVKAYLDEHVDLETNTLKSCLLELDLEAQAAFYEMSLCGNSCGSDKPEESFALNSLETLDALGNLTSTIDNKLHLDLSSAFEAHDLAPDETW